MCAWDMKELGDFYSMRASAFAIVGFALLSAVPATAQAKLKVFACLPEWEALTKEIGGDGVEVFTAVSPHVNPEQVSATPALISALSQADLLVCTGGGFEDGWLPAALQRAQNPKLDKGKPGAFYAAGFVKFLKDEHDHGGGKEKKGHAHGEGNPHIQGDPNRVRTVAGQLARRMIELDPSGAAAYGERAKTFIKDFGALIKELEAKAKPLHHIPVVVQHEHSEYLLAWLDMEPVAVVEPEPGIPPGPADLARVVETAAKAKAKFALYAAYEDPRPSRYVTERTGIPLVKLPFTVGGTDDAMTLADFYRASVDRLLDGLAGRERN